MFKRLIAAAAIALLASCAAQQETPAPSPETAAAGLQIPVSAALGAPDRPAADRERDGARNPAALLALAAIERGDHVADLGAGGGYMTRLLSTLVGPEGRVIAHNPPLWVQQYAQWIAPGLTQLQADRANVEVLEAEFDQLGLAPASLDAIVMALIYHDITYLPADRQRMNAGIFTALKPGGIYIVEDHYAADGAGVSVAESLHRIEPSIVRAEIEAAGFVFEGQSEALRHPDDDRTKNVFDESIRGRTDRFVFLFRKPAT